MSTHQIPAHITAWARADMLVTDAAKACARALLAGHTKEAEHQALRMIDAEQHLAQLERNRA
jgi:hypothetical protein